MIEIGIIEIGMIEITMIQMIEVTELEIDIVTVLKFFPVHRLLLYPL